MTEGESKIDTAGGQPADIETKKQPARGLLAGLTSRKNSLGKVFDVSILIRYIYPATIIVNILICFWIMHFLYYNVYLTMTQAEIVSNLKSKVIEESVDYSKFNDITKRISDKKALALWPYLNYLSSPFSYGARIIYPDHPELSPNPTTSTSATSTAKTTSTSAGR